MDWVTATYWICLLVGIIYTVASFILGGIADVSGHFGDLSGGHGGFSHDYGVNGHGGHGETSGSFNNDGQLIFGPFSPLVISFFLTIFGAAGIVLSRMLLAPVLLSLPAAVAAAVALAWLLIVLGNRLFGNMHVSSEIRQHTLIGTEAEVTVAIPESSIGEIAYVAMGSRNVAPARSEDLAPIPRFATVRIARIVGNIFFVRLVVEEQLRARDTMTQGSGSSTPLE